jgi:TatA/E family protein of Tat protein translocase
MEILGIGPMELVLILIIAMLVFGPDKLPEIGAKLGQSMKAMRKATREFSREIEGARQAVQAPVQELTQPFKEIAQPVQEIGQDLKSMAPLAQAVTNPQEALRQAVTGQLTAAPETQDAAANPPAASADAGLALIEPGPGEASAGLDAGEPAGSTADETVPETPANASQWQGAGVKPANITRRKLDRTRRQRWQPGSSPAAMETPAQAASADSPAAQPGARPAGSPGDLRSTPPQADDDSVAAPDAPGQSEA